MQNEPGYSQTLGLQLLESTVVEFGPLFSLAQIKPMAQAHGMSDNHLRNLISALADSGWIEILKRGTYLVRSPLYSGEVPVYAIAAALVKPMAISHWSACAHHGFTTQNPSMIQASTPVKVITPEMRTGKARTPRGRAVWTVSGHEFEFIYVNAHRFWGFEKIWVNAWQQVNITDPERTALDIMARAGIFGGFSAAMEILQNAVGQIDIERLVEYLLKYGVGSVVKRAGWALENLGISDHILEPLQNYPVKRYYLLDPSLAKGTSHNTRWQINENIRRY